MKPFTSFCFFLVITLGLSGCIPAGLTPAPTRIETPVFSPTPVSPTANLAPTATETPTLPATLEPEQVRETIKTLLQESGDCDAPCFLGIMPGRTTLEEAKKIFASLGLPVNSTTQDNKEFYGIAYDFDGGLSIRVILTVQEDVVKNLRVGIIDETQVGVPRQWSAYSPETLISRYGAPSRVDFFLGRVAPTPTHSMDLYFEEEKLIVEYTGVNLLNVNLPKVEICPLTNQVDYIQIWMGNDPQYPPSPGVPLEEAASLTMDQFSKLMTRSPDKACFNLKEEKFP